MKEEIDWKKELLRSGRFNDKFFDNKYNTSITFFAKGNDYKH